MNDSTGKPPEEDPWGFAASKPKPRATTEAGDDPFGAFARPQQSSSSEGEPGVEASGQRLSGVAGSKHGHHLRDRAFSLTVALSTVFALGFIAEIVA
ncbi:MAG: hypothetical protein JHD40_07290, partial [Acidimicrobiia bacterium]|nr:hypothetical protein [Acidimicrobiia bacterium]